MSTIDRIASFWQERVDSGDAIPSDVFADLDDPDLDYLVCFAAGTPVLMADGSRKPVESTRPGDLVLAADFLNPEMIPTPARELTSDDFCLSASGKLVAFASYETLAEEVAVYNFEVESFHTCFVGIFDGILVHNDCPKCEGKGFVEEIPFRVFKLVRYKELCESVCPTCAGTGTWEPYIEQSEFSSITIWEKDSDGYLPSFPGREKGLRKDLYKYDTERVLQKYGEDRGQVLIDLLDNPYKYVIKWYNYRESDLKKFDFLWAKESKHYERRFKFNRMKDYLELGLQLL